MDSTINGLEENVMKARHKVRTSAVKCKEQLSSYHRADVSIDQVIEGKDFKERVDRVSFEKFIEYGVQKTLRCIQA